MRYTYDAAGSKLVKVVDGTVSQNNTRLDYSGNFLYENGDLKAIFTSAGRIVPVDIDGDVLYKFEYNLQDHLGNTRVVFGGHSNGQPEVMQVTDYYPFGMVMSQQNYFASGVLSNKYLYNNKELQDDELAGNSLNWYDYGARFYDPQLARWHVIDNKAEKYYGTSPYTYALNNPILFLDPDGNDVKISTIKNAQTGRTTVTFNVTMSVRNSSFVGDKVVMTRAVGIKNQIEKSYSGFNSKTNTEYVTKVTFDQGETDYVLDFVNDVEGRSSMFTSGKVDEIGNTTENRMQVELEPSASGGENQTEAATARTGAHEYGHTLGLRHGEDTSGKGSLLKSKTTPNLMNQSEYTNSTKITTGQLDKGKATAERDQAIEIRRANNDKYSKNQY